MKKPLSPAAPETLLRAQPQQERGARTVDLILAVTAQLLEEAGFEKLSTNAICERAGLTPPALYRYFPNKYAVLKELGTRLMAAQNAALAEWLSNGPTSDDLRQSLAVMLLEQHRVTRAQAGGGWIMRSLRASPFLMDVRQQSNLQVVDGLLAWLLGTNPRLDPATARLKLRIAVEAGYAVIEMLSDDPNACAEAVCSETAEMLAGWLSPLLTGGY
jgi:AcrR family transcriptional regulator